MITLGGRGKVFPDVEAVLEEIRRLGVDEGDYESAHGLEDDLWAWALEQIANGPLPSGSRGLARSVLKSRELEFSRYAA